MRAKRSWNGDWRNLFGAWPGSVPRSQMSQPDAPWCAIAIVPPSADQSRRRAVPPVSWGSESSPPVPLAERISVWYWPPRFEAYAIRLPSGDHTGNTLWAEPNVTREVTPRTRSRTQRSATGAGGWTMPTATRVPSGESRISRYWPGGAAWPSMRTPRSTHTNRDWGADEEGRYASTPFRETENSLTPSTTATATPEVRPEPGSNRWASSVPPLVERR